MKLIYLWVKNHQNFILDQGYSFSPEYKVFFDKQNTKLTIRKNENYIEGFYGKNVLEVAAIVGDNGAGKSTLAKVIYDKCKSVQPVLDRRKKLNRNKGDLHNDYFKQIQVYVESFTEDDIKKEKIIIYYFLGSGAKLTVDCYNFNNDDCINLDELKNNKLGEHPFSIAEEKHKITTVYLTNAFDINHSIANRGFSESNDYGIDRSIAYSPMYNFKKAILENGDLYGSNKPGGFLTANIIKQYADRMNLGYFEAYDKYQGYDFLLAFKNAPKSIKDKLPIFREFKISISMFGDYRVPDETSIGMFGEHVDSNEKYRDIEKNFDTIVDLIWSNIGNVLDKNINLNTLTKKIYINVLCEIILFLNIWDQPDDFEPLNEEKIINLDDENAFELILDYLSNMDSSKNQVIEWIKQIKDIKTLDISMLKRIRNLIVHEGVNSNITRTNWFKQFEDYIDDFEKNKGLQLLEKVNFENSDIIDFLLKEFKKNNSIYKRMIDIKSISSSTGETALVNIFASLYRTMEIKSTKNNIILIIDELDAYLHPRWQQKILHDIITWINDMNFEKKIQLIFTSHSPIILSDLTDDRVIKLKKNENDNSVTCICKEKTLGANISTLFYDSFFMDKGSIGEISKQKIAQVINYVKGDDSEIDSDREAKYIINNIGEPIVKQKLMADLKLKDFKEENYIKQISQKVRELTDEKRQQVLRFIEQKGGEASD